MELMMKFRSKKLSLENFFTNSELKVLVIVIWQWTVSLTWHLKCVINMSPVSTKTLIQMSFLKIKSVCFQTTKKKKLCHFWVCLCCGNVQISPLPQIWFCSLNSLLLVMVVPCCCCSGSQKILYNEQICVVLWMYMVYFYYRYMCCIFLFFLYVLYIFICTVYFILLISCHQHLWAYTKEQNITTNPTLQNKSKCEHGTR